MVSLGHVVTAAGGSAELLTVLSKIGVSSTSTATRFGDDAPEFASNVISLVVADGLPRLSESDEQTLPIVWTLARARGSAVHGTRAGASRARPPQWMPEPIA